MPNYRRAWTPGGTFFFTHALLDRTSDLLVTRVDALRGAVTRIRVRHPFDIHAFVVLPDHLHAVLRLPDVTDRVKGATHDRRYGASRRVLIRGSNGVSGCGV
ncbi:MAG: transposase, partial [Xanthomonadaceae bacterium]|nr:transposase [Xanthomonadaceae bacterium]